MAFDLKEITAYYKGQGAPSDQGALVSMLKEIQQELGGGIPNWVLAEAAQELSVKESFLVAVIRRIPSLRLADTHVLELCAGPNCSKRGTLAAFVEKTYGSSPKEFTLRYMPCMRMCGKGPNFRWDGKLYNGGTEEMIRTLVESRNDK